MKPLSIALTPKRTLLIGAGKVAAQKARVLDSLGFKYTIVAETIFDAYFESKALFHKPFDDEDVKGYEIVIDATGNEAVTNRLVALKAQHHF